MMSSLSDSTEGGELGVGGDGLGGEGGSVGPVLMGWAYEAAGEETLDAVSTK